MATKSSKSKLPAVAPVAPQQVEVQGPVAPQQVELSAQAAAVLAIPSVAPTAAPAPKAKAKRYASLAVLANNAATIEALTPIEATGKKPGSKTHAKYSLFEVGLTIAQIEAKFIEAKWGKGKARNQLRWDIEHGFVTLAQPKAAS